MVCSQPKLLRQVAWWLGWRAINTCCKLLLWALTEKKVFGMDLDGLILGQNPEPIGWGTPNLVAWDAEKSFLSRESKTFLYPLPYYLFAKEKKKKSTSCLRKITGRNPKKPSELEISQEGVKLRSNKTHFFKNCLNTMWVKAWEYLNLCATHVKIFTSENNLMVYFFLI